jgi:hypothetical protein
MTILELEMSKIMMKFFETEYRKKNCIVYMLLDEVRMYGTDRIIWGTRRSISNERLLFTKLAALDCIAID